MKILIVILIALAVIGGGGGLLLWWHYSAGSGAKFRTVELTRGEMIPTISATGTVEPLDSIDVGAQVAGQIISFGDDLDSKTPDNKPRPIDFRSRVETNMVLATIDSTLYDADLESAKATLKAAEAMVDSAKATLEQYKAQYTNAKSAWDRASKLGKGEAISENDYETARAAFGVAEANLKLGDAQIKLAEANVRTDVAQLSKAQKNVDYCIIKSPVNGVVIDRRVNVGQTVVSSLNTPSLFLIAKDLSQIQVWVSVNEADIDKVHPDQKVSFTVDAFPGKTFTGTVGKVRLNAQMTQNVVTYTVEVNTRNENLELFPYMTANVQFEIAHKNEVLLVPNSALRWYPTPEMVLPDVRKAAEATAKAGPDPAEAATAKAKAEAKRRPGSATRPATRPANAEPHGKGTIWVTEGKYVRPVKVRTGYTDGVNTEITFIDKATELPVTTQIIVGEQRTVAAESGTTNPFAPQSSWGKKR